MVRLRPRVESPPSRQPELATCRREATAGLGERVHGERGDRDVHVRPQRQADQRGVQLGRIGCVPDAAVGPSPRNAPDRSHQACLLRALCLGRVRPRAISSGRVRRDRPAAAPRFRPEIPRRRRLPPGRGRRSAATFEFTIRVPSRLRRNRAAFRKGPLMATVTFENTTRIYRRASAGPLTRLNLEIADGEFLVLVGPSGCGKTDEPAHARRSRGRRRGHDPHRRQGHRRSPSAKP